MGKLKKGGVLAWLHFYELFIFVILLFGLPLAMLQSVLVAGLSRTVIIQIVVKDTLFTLR